MTWTIILAVLTGLAYPVFILLTNATLKTRIEADPGARLADYKLTIAVFWMLTVLILINIFSTNPLSVSLYPEFSTIEIIVSCLVMLFAILQLRPVRITGELTSFFNPLTLGSFAVLFMIQPVFSQPRTITINNKSVRINTLGLENRKKGQPLIIFESGLGTPMDNWDRILEQTSALAPVVTYDRPGIGQSDSSGYMPTIKNVADNLCKLIR